MDFNFFGIEENMAEVLTKDKNPYSVIWNEKVHISVISPYVGAY